MNLRLTPSLPLRPYQQDDVAAFLAAKPHRQIIAHPPAAGKTAIAIACAQSIGARHILVVCPALARSVWVAEFQKWSQSDCKAITAGHNRSLSGIARTRNIEAWGAQVRAVSYGLLKDVLKYDTQPLDMVIFDEAHNLRDPLSKVSGCARDLLHRFPSLPCLALTATVAPTRIEQAWNPIDTLFPGWFGARRPDGDVSWRFLTAFCERIENDFGTVYTGAKSTEAMEKLHVILKPMVRRITDEVLSAFLPPIDAQPLWVDDIHRSDNNCAIDFAADAWGEGVRHIAVVAYTREKTEDLYLQLRRRYSQEFGYEGAGVYHFDGRIASEARAEILDHFKRSGGILVCTCESIREAINLSFVKSALVLQWRTSPAQALQLLGRFRRPNDDHRLSRIRYLVRDDEERSRASLLQRRLDTIATALKADSSQEILSSVFAEREHTDAEIDSMLDQLAVKPKNVSQEW